MEEEIQRIDRKHARIEKEWTEQYTDLL